MWLLSDILEWDIKWIKDDVSEWKEKISKIVSDIKANIKNIIKR